MRTGSRLVAAGTAVVVLLTVASTVAFAPASGAFRSSASAPNGQFSAPALPGTVMNAELVNMGASGMMGGGVMMGGTMRVLVDRQEVNHGTVSLRVANVGSLVHELVVLPLADGRRVGSRTVASDGKVSEDGIFGETSKTCGAGPGDGINPRALGWTTLDLAPGTYELVCNLPGHYAAGMYTELRVTLGTIDLHPGVSCPWESPTGPSSA